VNPLGQQIREQTEAAEEFAGQRELEEDLIRASARGQLTGSKDVISDELEQAIQQATGQQEAAQTAYSNLLGTESPEQRAALQEAASFLRGGTAEDPGELLGQDVVDAFNTPGYLQTQEGKALMDQIMSDPRYAAIAGVDPLGLRITNRGKQFYSTGEMGGQDIREVHQDRATRALLQQRQKELEQAFGTGGAYNVTNPLYHGEEYAPLDIRDYLDFDVGTAATRENLSTDEQRGQYNRITDLLGELDRIGEAQPFRAAQIYAQANQHLQDEEVTLEAKGENLTEAQKQWKKMVKKARKKYKKAKVKPYAQIGKILGTVVGAVGTAPIGGIGAFAGGDMGEKAGTWIGKELT
jgi:hypothetical protein